MAVLLATLCAGLLADWWSCLPPSATATYVGRQSCVKCHAPQAAHWQGSHHDLAMDLATESSVLGDFSNAELAHDGMVSRMFRRGDQFMIHTEGPDGRLADFEIKYVFGVDPLQQYMVEFDRPAGMPDHQVARLQVLRVSWDTHRKRWFYLRPPDVPEKLDPSDDLHWTGIAQRWNNMCADCHSTNLQKNFNVVSKTYHTTFSEVDVSCEACHGPGSLHVDLATANSLFWDRKRGFGLANLKDSDPSIEIDTCATCHSRRRVVHPGFKPGDSYYDYYANELLYEHTYHADGQIMDEVYVFGSYIQSKMYHKLVRCTDCHDPHTARLKHDGNRVCTSCHQHSAGKYDSPAHHRHGPGSAGAQCVACHMPSTTYMAVDPRRDHSLRIPRPDLSVSVGTPNACTGCHLDQAPLDQPARAKFREYADWLTAARGGDQEVQQALEVADRWSAAAFTEWYGEKQDVDTHFAGALAAARDGEPSAVESLIEIAKDRRNTPIVRASCLMELTRYGSAKNALAAAEFLKDPDPQVRTAALGSLEFLPNEALIQQAAPLLHDPSRVVRTEAARVLARSPRELLRGPQRLALRSALDEFERGILTSNDRAAAHLTLGVHYENRNAVDKARQAYRLAIQVEPTVSGPRTNLAALYDRLARQAVQRVAQLASVNPPEAERLHKEIQDYQSEAARLRREELQFLQRDAKLAPDNGPILYRYGLSLYLHDRHAEAEKALLRAVELEPKTPDFALAVALLYQKQGRIQEAIDYCQRTIALRPDETSYHNLLRELQQQLAGSRSGQ